jgi:hypothetical protein
VWRGQSHPELDDPPAMGPEFGVLAESREVVLVLRTREMSESYRQVLDTAAESAEAGSRRRVLFFQIRAELLAYVFEVDSSLASIEEAVRSGLLDLMWMDCCPVLEAVRKDARFARLRQEVEARARPVIEALTELL